VKVVGLKKVCRSSELCWVIISCWLGIVNVDDEGTEPIE
jgi:hypothetical protein